MCTHPDWDDHILKLTDGSGVDLVVEVGGVGTLPRSLNTAKPGGLIAVIGVIAGGGEINPVPLIPKALRMQGIYVGHRASFEVMNAALERHKLRPVIDQRIALSDAPEAWRALPSGAHFGKIVIALETEANWDRSVAIGGAPRKTSNCHDRKPQRAAMFVRVIARVPNLSRQT